MTINLNNRNYNQNKKINEIASKFIFLFICFVHIWRQIFFTHGLPNK